MTDIYEMVIALLVEMLKFYIKIYNNCPMINFGRQYFSGINVVPTINAEYPILSGIILGKYKFEWTIEYSKHVFPSILHELLEFFLYAAM